MSAPQVILDLVDRFHQQIDAYKSGSYNETQLRREFLDPLFKALGWDIDNTSGYAEAYKDVIHEESIKIGGFTKAPDYCFRIGGTRKFFLEAKKPSVNIKDDINPAFQLRRYAWSAKLPLSILSDFEELAVYDCRIKPVKTDKSSTARSLYINYQEYPQRWDEIEAIFSREAVLKGSFDKYAETGKGKRGTAEVDAAFLKEIESWRELLARTIALRNPQLTQRELNFAVQQTIDRIIFLRICEDRGIDEYDSLRAVINGAQVYPRLCELFQKADDKYNSGLFHFSKEKGRDAPDDCTLNLVIDDKPLKDIIGGLYYPDCPYEFSVFSSDILGQVYEQFLGKVIRLTDGHRAVIEDKPEVKKAGGVYYTPTYIVDYIVKNTVGALAPPLVNTTSPPSLANKISPPLTKGDQGGFPAAAQALPARSVTPKQVEKLRILDPACGSGSFLIGAYQYLLDWHRDWYVADNPQKWAGGKSPVLYQAHGSEWKLTTAERRRIVLNNIYGVDIDPQAVEVTKLSLLLKVLEGESEQTLSKQLKLFQERALPDLDSNIKCGNSLIGPDYYQGSQTSLFDEEERLRVNVFDWQAEFPAIMKSGGFDAVIGNPPYGAHIEDDDARYLRQFEAATNDLDTYSLFMEKSLHLLKTSGLISMIVPTGWYSGAKFIRLRQLVAILTDPVAFVNLPYDIFKAWVDTTIFVALKREQKISWPRKESCNVALKIFPKRCKINSADDFVVDLKKTDFKDWFITGSDEYLTYADSSSTFLMQKIDKTSVPFKEVADIQRGVTPFKLLETCEHETCRPALNGTVRRYKLQQEAHRYIRFDKSLAEPKPEKYFIGQRILLRELISRQFQLQAVKVMDDFVTNKSMQSILPIGSLDINYLLGLINSRLLSWYFLHLSNIAQRDDFPKIVLKETRNLPIRTINFSDPADKKRHDTMVDRVEAMLSLNKQLAAAKTAHEKTALQRQIDATDRQIDNLVYELYGLTDDEIKIVEGA